MANITRTDIDQPILPLDILEQICVAITSWSTSEIAPLRRISRPFYGLLTEAVFCTVTLSPTGNSWNNLQNIINSRLKDVVKRIQLRGERYIENFDGLSHHELRRWLEDPKREPQFRNQLLRQQEALCRLRNYSINTNSAETASMRVALMEKHRITLQKRLDDEMSLQDVLSDSTKCQLDLTPLQFRLPACNTLFISQWNLLNPKQKPSALPFQPLNLDSACLSIFNKWAEMNVSRHSDCTYTLSEQILQVELPVLRHLTFRGCSISPRLLHAFLDNSLRYLETLELRDVVVITDSYWYQLDSRGSWFGLMPLLQIAEAENLCRLKLRGRMRNGFGYGWEFHSCEQCDMSTANKKPCCGLAIIEDAMISGNFSRTNPRKRQIHEYEQMDLSIDRLHFMSAMARMLIGKPVVEYIEPRQLSDDTSYIP